MGKTMVTVTVRMWNIFDEDRIEGGEMESLEIESQIDNGSVRVVLPEKIASELKLKSRGKRRVRYADMRFSEKEVVSGLVVEILGRSCTCDAIVEPERDVPLIGQIVLEDLDLLIDSKKQRLIPNPESPDMPMYEIYWARGDR